MQITKADLAQYADFTVNISDTKVNFQIRDAGLMDVAPLITRARYEAILLLPEVPNPEVVETADDLVLRALYAALVPFWAMCAYKRIIAFHGVSVTQAGLVAHRTQDEEQVSDKQRGELLGAIRSKIFFYQTELEAYMKLNKLMPEPESCSTPARRGSIGIIIAKPR